jgi:hypothetical protein
MHSKLPWRFHTLIQLISLIKIVIKRAHFKIKSKNNKAAYILKIKHKPIKTFSQNNKMLLINKIQK